MWHMTHVQACDRTQLQLIYSLSITDTAGNDIYQNEDKENK